MDSEPAPPPNLFAPPPPLPPMMPPTMPLPPMMPPPMPSFPGGPPPPLPPMMPPPPLPPSSSVPGLPGLGYGGMMMMPLPPMPPMPPSMGLPPMMASSSTPSTTNNDMNGGVKEEEDAGQAVPLLPPTRTVYVNNLNEKIKEKELKKTLQAIFSEHGKIVQIIAMKSLKRRGQAFIVFESIESAQNAVKKLQGFLLKGKKMRLNYSKTMSDVVAKEKGEYVPRVKKPLPPKPTQKRAHVSDDESDEEEPAAKRAPPTSEAPKPATPRPPPRAPVVRVEDNPPNRILKLSGLPQDITTQALQTLFVQFPGFKEVRLVPGLYDIAFVEYDMDMSAVVAKTSLQGAMLDESHPLVMSYAKK